MIKGCIDHNRIGDSFQNGDASAIASHYEEMDTAENSPFRIVQAAASTASEE
jgi:hypothetical protein